MLELLGLETKKDRVGLVRVGKRVKKPRRTELRNRYRKTDTKKPVRIMHTKLSTPATACV